MKKVTLNSNKVYLKDLTDHDYIGIKTEGYKDAVVKVKHQLYIAITVDELVESNRETGHLYYGETIQELIQNMSNHCKVEVFTFETEEEFKKWLAE